MRQLAIKKEILEELAARLAIMEEEMDGMTGEEVDGGDDLE